MRWSFVVFFIIAVVTLNLFSQEQQIKKCEFAGLFYPANKEELNSMLDGFLKEAVVPDIEGEILGIISPHAGYIYSGQVAAYSYNILNAKQFDAIVLLGASHHYYFEGITIYPSGVLDTPVGSLEVDQALANEFKSLDFAQFKPGYFNGEHSLEVQLPFIIKVLGNVKVVPILFGKVSYENLENFAEKLVHISSHKKILIVVSTDLSHYLLYDEAVKVDTTTSNFIKNQDIRSLINSEQPQSGRACGISPVVAFIMYSKNSGAEIRVLKYLNSGDTAPDKSRVVGYLSAASYKPVKK